VDDGLLPDLALGVVESECQVIRLHVPFVKCRKCLSHAAVKHLAARGEDPAIRHLPHTVVGDVQALAHAVQHA
jgi:hypothetical protein